ncbi:MATE family efflux transporter [Desulforhopalus vacuolatus]|uniref:MATE family efflux transporter n=1 Tax=Desulforhopalus vacuolatus TaxID=40414 RepID=UPI0019646389|nr:MATE family efflux transporter [Desulforhopalus vacuolatus]MBM9518233.1 MATE family efflux transporter [Desulforhopalus vacuolatus]
MNILLQLFHITPKRYLQYRTVLRVCLPLVLSLSATTMMEFTDRIFLANYEIDAISAALPAASVSFLFLVFFGGVSGYAGVFIAQYTGRGDHRKVGSVLWQAIWFSLGAAVVIFILGLFAEPIFAFVGHTARVQQLERTYFSILCNGSVLQLTMVTLSAFLTGRGLTRPVMVITFIGVIINIPLDYALIFGHIGFPECGIGGAAIATVFSWMVNTLLLAILIFTRHNNKEFAVFDGWRFHRKRFFRLMRFGIPGAMQFTTDVATFTFFILLIGRIGGNALAATNIVFSINSLSFMPAMGASQGVSILVGQALGRGKPKQAKDAVRRASEMLFFYVLLVDIAMLFYPEVLLSPFFVENGPEGQAVQEMAVILLRIVAAFLFFDAFYMVFSGALRGAGDTAYMMWAAGLTGIFTMVLPVWVGIVFFDISITTAWFAVLAFLAIIFTISLRRYLSGKWQKMIVIEEE